MQIDAALRRFESWLRVEKNLSPRTRAAYLYDLARFFEWLRGARRRPPGTASDVSTDDVRDYVNASREEDGLRPTTVARRVSSIRAFFDFLVQQGALESNPCDGIHNPKRPPKLPIYLIAEEVRRLFAAPDRETPAGLRDHAMLVAMAYCGVRLQELVGLNLLDVDFESRTLRVLGKGSKERLIPMNDAVSAAMLAWLRARTAAEGEKAVFVNRFGRRLSGRMVEKIVDKYVAESGLGKAGVSPHKLRHTFATLLHANDVDLVEIQALLGHASISTTQIYTHTNARRLKGAVEKLEALGNGG